MLKHLRLNQIRSDQSLSPVWLFATPWIAACQASLSITNSWSSLRLTSIESVMPSSHLILCHPLLLLPPIPPSIRFFSVPQIRNSTHRNSPLLVSCTKQAAAEHNVNSETSKRKFKNHFLFVLPILLVLTFEYGCFILVICFYFILNQVTRAMTFFSHTFPHPVLPVREC